MSHERKRTQFINIKTDPSIFDQSFSITRQPLDQEYSNFGVWRSKWCKIFLLGLFLISVLTAKSQPAPTL